MTIFVDVVNKFIGDCLANVSASLQTKISSIGYDHDLSREQLEEIQRLTRDINQFKSTGNDANDAASLKKLIMESCNEIKSIRIKHKHDPQSGSTIASLTTLSEYVSAFYDKLVTFKFDLLNQQNKRNPDGIVYFYVCSYLCEYIFKPVRSNDGGIRIQKEEMLAEHLNTLRNEVIKPTHTLEQSKKCVELSLAVIEKDNLKIVQAVRPSSSVRFPSVSVLGMFHLGMPSGLLASGEGRLGEWIKVIRAQIEKLTLDSSDCPSVEILDAGDGAEKAVVWREEHKAKPPKAKKPKDLLPKRAPIPSGEGADENEEHSGEDQRIASPSL